ncbi:MAG: hypothetical protein F9B45_22140 [Phycisphaera sp. RhM]|nr:hypothetical protein [Phycisphaera sp. RhM]
MNDRDRESGDPAELDSSEAEGERAPDRRASGVRDRDQKQGGSGDRPACDGATNHCRQGGTPKNTADRDRSTPDGKKSAIPGQLPLVSEWESKSGILGKAFLAQFEQSLELHIRRGGEFFKREADYHLAGYVNVLKFEIRSKQQTEPTK